MKDEAKEGSTQEPLGRAWPRDLFGFHPEGFRKEKFLQLGSDPVRLNVRKLIPFQCGQEMPGCLEEEKSRSSETT